MVCIRCSKPNRSVARYCKNCGKELSLSQETTENKAPADPDFDQLCGLDDVKARIRRELTVFRNMRSAGKKYSLQQLHTVIIGETGTGKSKLVEQLAKIYFRNGITTKPDPVIVQAVNFSEFSRNLAGNIDAARGGILCIENVQQLVSDNSGDSQSTALDRLNAEMQNRDGDPIIILSSRSQSFRNYLEANPDINSRIPLKLYLSDFTVDQMMELACQMLEEEKYSMTDAVKAKLKNRFLCLFKNQMDAAKSLETARNGFLVQKEIKQIIGEHFLNPDYFLSPSALLESDIKGEVYKVRSTEDILRDLDDFVGMEGVREFLQNMINLLRVAKKDAETTGVELTVGAHMVLTGNPGTGKTTLARKLGEVFASAGILSSGHVVDVDRSKLVGQYIGETAQLVQKYCNDAMGGVLLVDEAYSLKQGSSDNVGQEAIDTLLKRMEDDRGKFIVIATGYKQEMQRFINANPGMKSRVKDNFFHLPDYTPPQLLEILKINVKQGQYILTPEAEEKAAKYLTNMYNRRTKEFGNGRDVRSFFEKTLEKRAARMTASADAERDFIIIADDIEDTNVDISNDKIEQLLAELDSLTGLHAVKLQMRSLVNFVRMEQRRAAEGGKNSELTLHCIFKGRPGTGKTTVGRILSNIYHGLGLLPKNHLVEVDRTKLVGEYIGQTAIKTSEKIDEAMGGVLFVDEAYTLAGSAGSSNDYGKEAIETLLKRMEDDRGNFIVIAAGYADDMDKFIKTNEGLASRFPTEITFDDYTGSELTSIFLGMLANKNMGVSDETKQKLAEFFDEVYERRDNKFANGRTVRNILEAALKAQSNRLLAIEAAGGDITGMLNTLEFADVSTEKKEDEKPTIDQILEELDQLTGLQKVKEEVRSLISYLQLEDIRRKSGGVTSPLSLHFIFKGRPGTGKTTVGRLLAKIFQQMGLLSKGHLVEVDRGKLVGEHIGATAIRTTERIDAAMGGILLVDEAYSLAPPNSPNDFGREAIDTLLKRMEDDRGKFIVIAAGYEGDMNRFIDSNEGLASRFTREIHFDDYNGPEMLSIFKGLVAKKGLMINSETEKELAQYLNKLYENRDSKFANGRTVRNIFEKSLPRQSNRLKKHLDAGEDIRERINELLLEDIIPK